MKKNDLVAIADNVITILEDEFGVKPSVDLGSLKRSILSIREDIENDGGLVANKHSFIAEFAQEIGISPKELEDIINEEIFDHTGVYMGENAEILNDLSPEPLERLPSLEEYSKKG